VQLQVQLGHVTGRIGDRRDVVAADDGGDDQADGPGDLGGLAALAPEADEAAGTDDQAEDQCDDAIAVGPGRRDPADKRRYRRIRL
jgi:hypothetical protein